MKDVARVVASAENNRLAAWVGDTPAIIVNVQRQPGANVIATVDAIKARLPGLTARCRPRFGWSSTDRTTGIRASGRACADGAGTGRADGGARDLSFCTTCAPR